MSTNNSRPSTMANGHAAGMQSGREFGERERRIKAEKETEMRRFDKEQSGLNAETTYRDKSGKKVDMLSQFLRKEAIEEGKKAKIEEAQQEWGKSRVQKELEVERLQEVVEIAAGPFARTVDDPRLERERKSAIREGDPMFEHFMELQRKEEDRVRDEFNAQASSAEAAGAGSQLQTGGEGASRKKPRYNGPNVAMNRFSHVSGGRPVLPGYRWDGVDRSNHMEKKILLKMNEKNEFREDEYRWSVADM